MKVLNDGRRSGKTERLIEWWLKNPSNRVILVANDMRRQDVLARIKEAMYGDKEITPSFESVVGPKVMTPHMNRRGFSYEEIAVDEIDHVLEHMLGLPISVATMTAEPLTDNRWVYE